MIGMMRVNDPAGVRINTTPETDALMTDKDVTAGITASQNQPARIRLPWAVEITEFAKLSGIELL